MDFCLDRNFHIISQLGMSGSWRISSKKIFEKHTHLNMKAKHNGKTFFLAYVDPRRFGKMRFFNEKNAGEFFDKLGVDVSSKDFSADYIYSTFQVHPKKIIKSFLLEQKYFAGIGNYMASEILALSRILPTRECKTISKEEACKIKKSTKKVIEGSLKKQGLTFSGGYVDAHGEKGKALQNLVVFHQKICGMCKKADVIKTIIGGRGTFFCPKCQK